MKKEISLNKSEIKKAVVFAKKENNIKNAYASGSYTNGQIDDYDFQTFYVEISCADPYSHSFTVKMNVFLPDRRRSFASNY